MLAGKQTTVYIKADELEAIGKLCKANPGLKPHHVFKLALRYLLFNERSDIEMDGFHGNVQEDKVPCSPGLSARVRSGEVSPADRATAAITNSAHTEKRITIIPEKRIEIVSEGSQK